MKYSIGARRRLFFRGAFAVALVVGAWPEVARAATYRPDPASPLATDNRDFYAVAADRQTLLVARPPKQDWVPLTTIKNSQIRGLTWAFGRLYFSSETDGSIQFVSTIGGERAAPIVVHRGAPLVRPGELAFAGSLIVADPGAGTLFRIPQTASASGPQGPVPIRIPMRMTEGMFITAWPPGEVLISDPESGVLAQITDAGGSPRFRRLQERREDGASKTWQQRAEQPGSVRRQGYPGVNYPGPIAVHNGIVYMVDTQSHVMFAAGIHDTRAIRLPMQGTVAVVTRLVVNNLYLAALEGRTGRLVNWPRVVPSEVTLMPGARMQSLFPVIEYLQRRKLLSTRMVEVTGSLKETLANARMIWPERGSPAELVTPERHFASFCLLNPQYCDKGGLPREDIAPGSRIVLADLYAERFTSAARVTLDGTQTLGAVADAAITSDEFTPLKNEEHLKRMNGYDSADSRVLRNADKGQFRISQEAVRYVIPIEATELRAGTEFRQLEVRVQRTLRIDPLERVPTSAASGDASGHPNDPNCLKARQALATLIDTIKFVPTVATRTVYVGVAEPSFDPHHRDFVDPATGTRVVHVLDDDHGPEEAHAGDAPVATPTAPGVEPVRWRDFAADDHGTAVAALVAGRTRAYQDGAGFTRAMVAMFMHADDATALGGDLERALNRRLMTVVNLSLKSLGDSQKLRTLMETKVKETLFVVAAPNSDSQVTLCAGNQVWFPACHGRTFANVLVVGGTMLDGKRVHGKSPIGNDVHLFAPEEGYFSAGRDNSYVSVTGTSFATALVSAAAAMLSGAGIDSPSNIRQRLITTADVIETPNRPQWARLLNIKRAVSHLDHAVIVDANTAQEQPARVVNGSDTLSFKAVKGGRTILVPVGDVRRLSRVKGTDPIFDLAYVVPGPDDVDGAPTEKLAPLLSVRPQDLPWRVCYEPLGADGLSTGAPVKCVDLQEKADYVGPIR